jgi:hypothetical protein
VHTYGGGTTTGRRTALQVSLTQSAANTDTSVHNFYQGGSISSTAKFSQPGATAANPLGAFFALNFISNTDPTGTPTNLRQIGGIEINPAINAGASAAIRSGLTIADLIGANQGFWDDNMIWLYGAGAKWRAAMMLGDTQAFPLDAGAGAIIAHNTGGAYFADTTQWGLSLDQLAFPATGNPYDGGLFKTKGASMDGAGTLRLGTTYFTSAATGIAIDAKGAVGTGASINTAGAWAFSASLSAGNYVFTGLGGVWSVTFNSSAVPTAVSVLVQPSIPSTASPPATITVTPASRMLIQSAPLVLNVTWNTTATELSLQPGGGTIKVGGGAVTANGAVATVLGSLGPAGSHTSPQEWFVIRNASGTVRYIPAF